jgi:hypothetical protein
LQRNCKKKKKVCSFTIRNKRNETNRATALEIPNANAQFFEHVVLEAALSELVGSFERQLLVQRN